MKAIYQTTAAFNAARAYWYSHPVTRREKIAVIGGGEYSNELMDQALRENVFSLSDGVEYCLFGMENYREARTGLPLIASIGETSTAGDSIFFMGDWNGDASALASFDRVIIATDDKAANIATAAKIAESGISGAFDLTSLAVSGGDDVSLAMRVHAAYTRDGNSECREKCPVIDPEKCMTCPVFVPTWENLSEIQYFSNIAAADHMPVRLALLGLTDDEYSKMSREEFVTSLGFLPSGAEPYQGKGLSYDDEIAAAEAFYGFKPEFRNEEKSSVMSAKRRYELMCIEHERWNRFYFIIGYTYRETPSADELIDAYRARSGKYREMFTFEGDDSPASRKKEAKIAREYFRLSTKTHNCLLPFDKLDFWAKLYDFFVYKNLKDIM